MTVAAAATLLNIGVMGLYDVIAFEHTRSRWFERWRYGAVSFAWSNFLTLGPLAGPAIRFWLYRPAVDKPADLEGGVVSIATAFTAGLGGWALAAWLLPAVSDVRVEIALVGVAFFDDAGGRAPRPRNLQPDRAVGDAHRRIDRGAASRRRGLAGLAARRGRLHGLHAGDGRRAFDHRDDSGVLLRAGGRAGEPGTRRIRQRGRVLDRAPADSARASPPPRCSPTG